MPAPASVGAVLFAASVLDTGPAANATQDSVPLEVAEYAKHELGDKLNDVFGVGGSGAGIDFDETTTTGPISRVFGWTGAYAAGEKTGTPVELLNQWVTTVSIDEKVMGFATIWINDATVRPELVAFDRGLAIGAALLDLPAEATLVRDDAHGAWFTLADGVLTALEPDGHCDTQAEHPTESRDAGRLSRFAWAGGIPYSYRGQRPPVSACAQVHGD